MLFPNNGVIMFKKNLPLIFLITVFLSFDNQTKAMQESDLESTSEKTKELQRNTLFCKYCGHEPCNTLKFLAASEYLKTLKAQGIDLNALDHENENYRRILETVPEELIEYCQKCPIIPIIHKHIASLEKSKEYKCLKFTDENLCIYNTLLHKLINNIDIQNISIELILFEVEHLNLHNKIMTLEDFNVVLKLLLQPKDIDLSDQERTCLNNIWNFIVEYDYYLLFELLAKNRKLLPPLNHIIVGGRLNQMLGNSINGLMFLVKYGTDINPFEPIIDKEKNINLLKSVIDDEKNKNYDWKMLLNVQDRDRSTILHCAVNNSKDILQIILELIKAKGLHDLLYDLINTQSKYGQTTLMMVANWCFCDNEIVQLLIDHGANINIPSELSGRTALYEVIRGKEMLLGYKDNINPERLEQFNRCIELLKSTTTDK